MECGLQMDRPGSVGAFASVASGRMNVQSLSDEELLRLCAQGREAALQELVRRYQIPLQRFLARYLGSNDDAEQAVLNVFVRAWQAAPRFQYRAQVSTWLYRIATNIAHDLHKRRSVRPQEESWPENMDMSAGPSANAEHEAMARLNRLDENRVLMNALNRLNESDRLVLVLYYFEERTYEEIQEIAGVSHTVLKMRLTRARQRLRRLLEREEGSLSS